MFQIIILDNESGGRLRHRAWSSGQCFLGGCWVVGLVLGISHKEMRKSKSSIQLFYDSHLSRAVRDVSRASRYHSR